MEETATILRHFGFQFDQRGLVSVKGKGKLMTFYLAGKKQPQQTAPVQQSQQASGNPLGFSRQVAASDGGGVDPSSPGGSGFKDLAGSSLLSSQPPLAPGTSTSNITAGPPLVPQPATSSSAKTMDSAAKAHQQQLPRGVPSNTNDRRMFITSTKQDLSASRAFSSAAL